MVRTPTRREYLTTLGVAGITGMAGCSDGSGNDTEQPNGDTNGNSDGSDSTSTVEFPSLSADDPTYRKWQPGTGEMKGLFAAAHNIGRYRDHRSELPAETYESGSMWAMFGGYVGIEYDELDGVLVGLGGPGVVSIGSFARSDVESRLEAMPYEQYTTGSDVTYYRWDRGESLQLVGVGAEGVISGTGRQDADDPATRFVDETTVLFETARGERPRLHEENDLYRQYTDAVGWPLVAWATSPRQLGGQGGLGVQSSLADAVSDDIATSVRVGPGTYLADGAVVERYWLWTIEDGSASPADVAAAYQDNSAQSELADDGKSLAVRRDGRVVDVGVLDPIANAGGGADPVLVSLDMTRDGQTVTVEHVAGGPVPLSRVTVRADGDTVDALTDGTLSPGSSRSFEVPGDTDTVRLVYSPPHSEDTTLIAST